MGSSLIALIRELKLDLYGIARQAELGNEKSLTAVQAQAEQAMRLIDSYILCTQAEYGQQQLGFEPLAIGSVMHEAAHSMRAIGRPIDIQANALQPVMTHRGALHGLLASASHVLADTADDKLVFRSFMTKNDDVCVGVFAKNIDLTTEDMRMCLQMSGKAHMPLARHSSRSGVMLVIADSLARSLGGTLEVKRLGTLRGLATTLPRSEQLSLV